MARLIDAELMEFAAPIDLRFLSEKHFKRVLNILRSQPTVDAVPVMRCKNCVYKCYGGRPPFAFTYCTNDKGLSDRVLENDFCPYGERRDTE